MYTTKHSQSGPGHTASQSDYEVANHGPPKMYGFTFTKDLTFLKVHIVSTSLFAVVSCLHPLYIHNQICLISVLNFLIPSYETDCVHPTS